MKTRLKKKESVLEGKIKNVKSALGKALMIPTDEKNAIENLYNGKSSLNKLLKNMLEVFTIRSQINALELKLLEQDVSKKILCSIDNETIKGDSLFFRTKSYKELNGDSRQVSSDDDISAGNQTINIGIKVDNEVKQLSDCSVEELQRRELELVGQLKQIKEKEG